MSMTHSVTFIILSGFAIPTGQTLRLQAKQVSGMTGADVTATVAVTINNALIRLFISIGSPMFSGIF